MNRQTLVRVWAFVALFGTASLLGCATSQQAQVPDSQATAPVKEQLPQDDFQAALVLFDAGKFPEALTGFQKALARAPQMVNAQYNIGVTHERLRDLGKARETYETAHKMDAAHEPTLLNLGKLYRLQERYNDAVALYEAALKLPNNEYDVELLNNLSVAYRLAKNYAKAEAAARKVLSRTKDNPEAYKNLALIYYDQGNFRLAEFISHNARKLDEKDPGVYNNLGMIYLRMEDRARALAQFQKAVALNNDFAPGHLNIGAMALSFRDYTTAEREFSKAVALDPTSFEALLYLGWALDGQKGREPKKGLLAGDTFEKALALRPGQTDAICGAGWGYGSEKTGWDKAVGYLEKCKGASTATPDELKAIEVKLQSIAAMKKNAQAQPADQEKREAPKAKQGGAALLEKVSEDEAQKEGVQQPAEGAGGTGTSPEGGTTPQGATPGAGAPGQ